MKMWKSGDCKEKETERKIKKEETISGNSLSWQISSVKVDFTSIYQSFSDVLFTDRQTNGQIISYLLLEGEI